jgi:hypothetical protein
MFIRRLRSRTAGAIIIAVISLTTGGGSALAQVRHEGIATGVSTTRALRLARFGSRRAELLHISGGQGSTRRRFDRPFILGKH